MQTPVGYCETMVSPETSRSIEAFWSYTAQNNGETLILPDGRCDIILRYNLYTSAPPLPIITGPGTSPYNLSHIAGDSWLGLRLQPTQGSLLWQKQIRVAADKVIRGTDAVGLLPKLAEVNRSHINFDFLKRAMKFSALESPVLLNQDRLSDALKAIHYSGGRLSIEKLAIHIGYSSRQLNRMFRTSVGLSTKTYCQIVQFHRTLNLIQKENMSITTAAFEGGYADHAHLTRSFQRFGGFAPSKLPPSLSIPTIFL